MLYRLISIIKFWFSATNQHGVHSPFMYRFVTKCLYRPSHYKSSRSITILLKTLGYFSIKEVQLVSSDKEIEKQLSLNGIAITNREATLICLDSLNQTTIGKYVTQNSRIGSDTIIYIPGIYRNRERNNFWQTLRGLEAVTVSLDMYYGGLIFFRKGQAKEHFIIRV